MTKIDQLQSEIDAHGQLNAELLKKIQYKFRLDWNYFSNAMEGNSLTRSETKQLMMDNVTIDGKPFKDISEMRGHDEVVQEIFKIGKGDVRISEKRIKEMHKAIMHEDDPEKRAFIGKWKQSNNHLINYRNEKFDFLDYSQVPEAMHALLNKTNAEIDALKSDKKEHKHPVLIAFEFHLEYVRIHPFYDGNGRTARLLTNLLLISFGYPPFLLSEKSRNSYNRILAEIQGYGGDRKDFHVLIGSLLIESQKLVLDAIAGKDISDEDDIDKEILLWKQGLGKSENEVIEKNTTVVSDVYENSLKPLFEEFLKQTETFSDLFQTEEVYNSIGAFCIRTEGTGFFNEWSNYQKEYLVMDQMPMDLTDKSDLKFALEQRFSSYVVQSGESNFTKMRLEIRYKGFKRNDTSPFDAVTSLDVKFDQYRYGISEEHGSSMTHEKLYSQRYTESEIKEIVKEKKQAFFQHLQEKTKG